MALRGYLALLRKAIAKNLRKMTKSEPLVLAGEVEPIHEYRVAVRRIRSALRLASEAVDEPQADKLQKKGREFARVTSLVRDLDVQIQHARADSKEGSALEAWILSLSMERQRAMATVEDTLGGKKYRRWKEKLDSWLETPFEDMSQKDQLAEAIRRHVDRIVQGKEDSSDDGIHALRIAIKRLRYLLEFFEDDLPKESRATIAPLAKIQDRLGEYHDIGILLTRLDKAISAAEGLEVLGKLRCSRSRYAKRKSRMRPGKAVAKAMEIVQTLV